jgi:hypothetical protein
MNDMKRTFSVTALALVLAAPLLAAPAFAQSGPITQAEVNSAEERAHGDQELADQLEWQELVARANAYRHEENSAPSYAAVAGVSATDAAQSPGAGGWTGTIATQPVPQR